MHLNRFHRSDLGENFDHKVTLRNQYWYSGPWKVIGIDYGGELGLIAEVHSKIIADEFFQAYKLERYLYGYPYYSNMYFTDKYFDKNMHHFISFKTSEEA